MPKELWKGNEAIAEAAVRAGLDAYFGYPITPQTEILEYLSKRMPELGRAFVQAESELGAINMVYGAACAGVRVMSSSSSPGVSLMMEGHFLYCGDGSAGSAGQRDARRTRSGQHCPGAGGLQPGSPWRRTWRLSPIVLAPASVQEAVDLMATFLRPGGEIPRHLHGHPRWLCGADDGTCANARNEAGAACQLGLGDRWRDG